jgi:hypothetical protein
LMYCTSFAGDSSGGADPVCECDPATPLHARSPPLVPHRSAVSGRATRSANRPRSTLYRYFTIQHNVVLDIEHRVCASSILGHSSILTTRWVSESKTARRAVGLDLEDGSKPETSQTVQTIFTARTVWEQNWTRFVQRMSCGR